MKSIVPIIVIIILLISICVGMELYMNSSCEEMLRLCDETAESLSAENAGYFADTWEETSRGWLLLISHTEINEISASIYEMAEHARMGNEDEPIVNIGNVRRKLEVLPQKIRLSWANFF